MPGKPRLTKGEARFFGFMFWLVLIGAITCTGYMTYDNHKYDQEIRKDK